ncbi:hypothetical protein BDV96DRAFT_574451 [Lophiotrema nucula]|uniref:Uncharacterized protein n=1 Tax=Lophiotrema nucula TaxID=690887 RepID=A0A6A5Z8K5_9PLEO|nr:hypothetical protein BDV96DRAFT_574451 [Lophiotrema nucula]
MHEGLHGPDLDDVQGHPQYIYAENEGGIVKNPKFRDLHAKVHHPAARSTTEQSSGVIHGGYRHAAVTGKPLPVAASGRESSLGKKMVAKVTKRPAWTRRRGEATVHADTATPAVGAQTQTDLVLHSSSRSAPRGEQVQAQPRSYLPAPPARQTDPSLWHSDRTEPPSSAPLQRADSAPISDALILSRILNHILDVAQDDPDLKGRWKDDAEGAVRRLVERYKILREGRNEDGSPGRIAASMETFNLNADLRAARSDLGHLRGRLAEQEESLKNALQENEHLRRDLDISKSDYLIVCQEHEDCDAKAARHYIDVQRARNDRAEELSALKKARDEFENRWKESDTALFLERNRITDDCNSKIEQLERRHKQDLLVAKAEMRTQTERDELEWQAQIQSAKLKHQEELGFEIRKHEAAETGLQDEIDRLTNARNAEKTQHVQALEDQRKAFEKEKLSLEVAYEKLKKDWVVRDHYKGLTDFDLKSRFQRLATQIEQISRINWDDSRNSSWPLSEWQLKRFLPENPRRLKQQILQNTMWMTLYDEVFGSPFVIMGEEGRTLDREWMKQFASNPDLEGFIWPEATLESEKWRYERAKPFCDTLERAGTSDVDKKHKNEFNRSVRGVVGMISDAIGKVATLGVKERQVLHDVVEMAGKLWLEVGSQRYRIRVGFPLYAGTTVDILNSQRTFHESLTVVIRPELRRFGNSLGQELSNVETLSGWNGDLQTHHRKS